METTRETIIRRLDEVLSRAIVRAVCSPSEIENMTINERVDALCAEIAFYDSVMEDQVDPWINFTAIQTREEMAAILSTAQCCIEFLNQ